MSRKRILWLASWYPNRYDKFNGDFIQRHAQAASIDNDIYVIHLQDAINVTDSEEELSTQNGLIEKIVYYKKGSGLLGKIIKQIRFFAIYNKAIKTYINKYGLPHCVHVHVPWKAGLLALWIKWKYGVSYLVTEHWDIYNKVVDDNYFRKPIYFKKLLAYIIDGSEMLISVSNFISQSINVLVTKKNFVFIPNAVNTSLFKYSTQKNSKFTFLHVSNMVGKKDVEGILRAFFLFLNEVREDVQLVLVGNTDSYYINKAEDIGLTLSNVVFRGEVPYEEVANEMMSAHCFILNSKIENSPCVIGEALCCGTPVIATRVGGIPELVNESNSILIEPQNTDELVGAMKSIYLSYSSFNNKKLSEDALQKFSFKVISRQFSQVYNQLLFKSLNLE